ncbi:MAG TPA: GNAT family N-acetyltransferase, partial [Polyangiales bacterium]|nr:GNAT family N-acetyltransferase [Polyangiales bacterium]
APLTPVETDAQIERVAELAREIWLEYYPQVIGREQTEYMIANLQNAPAIGEQVRAGMSYFLLTRVPPALDGSAPDDSAPDVGYAAVEARPPALFISKLYLLAAARGTGQGQRALHALRAHARALGLSRLELTVNRNNTLALRAYERFGMQVVGTQYAEIGGGYAMDDYVLRIEIEPEREAKSSLRP